MAEWLRAWNALAMMKLWRREVVNSSPDRGTIVGCVFSPNMATVFSSECAFHIRRSIASAFLFIAALEHAILYWSVRKQPQRIAFEIKCS